MTIDIYDDRTTTKKTYTNVEKMFVNIFNENVIQYKDEKGNTKYNAMNQNYTRIVRVEA